jgi:hypothetical protein
LTLPNVPEPLFESGCPWLPKSDLNIKAVFANDQWILYFASMNFRHTFTRECATYDYNLIYCTLW